MGIKCEHLRDFVIIPTLKYLDMYSDAAVNLLLGTAAQESHMGYYLKQVNGPAVGIYQKEPKTHLDLWGNYIEYKKLSERVYTILFGKEWRFSAVFYSISDLEKFLITNLSYATAMARIHYWRFEEPLPEADNLEGLADYWKKYYNTELGKGTVEEFCYNYGRYVK